MKTAKLLQFGKGGYTLYFSKEGLRSCTSSGYLSPESFVKPYHWWADPPEKLTRHWDGYKFPKEGIPIIDKLPAIKTPSGFHWVFEGPMVDVDLEDGAVSKCPEPSPTMASAVAGNTYGALLTEHKEVKKVRKHGSLDSVSVKEYVDGWREHGARIGRLFVEDNVARIEWEK